MKKRSSIFQWLKNKQNGITLLQETHSMEFDEIRWKNEWGGNIFFAWQ